MPSQATDVRYIFLVGGFAESKALQHRVRNELEAGGRRVIVPLRPGLAVVKGAVMLGLGASERFASRLAKQTYGVDCSRRFDPSKLDHDGRRTFQRMDRGELVTYVGDHFSPIVAKGTRVALRQVHRGREIRKSSEHHASAFKVFTCQSPGTKWVTNAGVVKIGKVAYKARKGDRVRVDLCFGASEIRATVVNVTTGAETPAVIQYDFRRIARDGEDVAATGDCTSYAAEKPEMPHSDACRRALVWRVIDDSAAADDCPGHGSSRQTNSIRLHSRRGLESIGPDSLHGRC